MPRHRPAAPTPAEQDGPCRRYVEMTTAVLRSDRADLVAALAAGHVTVRRAYFTLRPERDAGA